MRLKPIPRSVEEYVYEPLDLTRHQIRLLSLKLQHRGMIQSNAVSGSSIWMMPLTTLVCMGRYPPKTAHSSQREMALYQRELIRLPPLLPGRPE
jgi:hypothetical protein